MRFARVLSNGEAIWAIFDGETAYRLEGDLFASPASGSALGAITDLKILSPVGPTNKVAYLLGNWGDPCGRAGPGIVFKPPGAMINPGEPVIYPDMARRVNLEPELAVVVGKTCKGVTSAEANSSILGYTISNDVTAFEVVHDVLFPAVFGKMFDTFGILGPEIVTNVDPGDLRVTAALNGETFLDISTSQMTWGPGEVVSWVSQVMTLNPGDVISMGAPPGFDRRAVQPGDLMRIDIEGLGTLQNPVSPN